MADDLDLSKPGRYRRVYPDGFEENWEVVIRDNKPKIITDDLDRKMIFKRKQQKMLDRAEHLGTAPKATPKRIPKATKDVDSPELVNERLREAREYMTDPRVSEADKIAFRVRAEMAR